MTYRDPTATLRAEVDRLTLALIVALVRARIAAESAKGGE